MKRSANKKKRESQRSANGITRITVAGYKSICKEQSIEIRPLTILAGANSSGKSSIMQPLLLLKQTLEADYDPGALLLNGPNIKFTSTDQLLSCIGNKGCNHAFLVGIGFGSGESLMTQLKAFPREGFEVEKTTYNWREGQLTLRQGMTPTEIKEIANSLPSHFTTLFGYPRNIINDSVMDNKWTLISTRCFLNISRETLKIDSLTLGEQLFGLGGEMVSFIRSLIHLSGLRGNPERTYPVTAVGENFPGIFKEYTASIIAQWQKEKSPMLLSLSRDLEKLGLTWKVTAKKVDDTQVALRVGRLTHAVRGGAQDLVNTADVGFGVSQTLPVLVALQVAKPGQLVYLEDPETHLHPYAQTKLAEVLAEAAKRGVRVVAETHSALLLLAIQALVAEGELLSPELVKLHWFERGEDGMTKITSADLDESGAFGEKWPEDFGDIELQAQSRYLDAVASRKKKFSRAG